MKQPSELDNSTPPESDQQVLPAGATPGRNHLLQIVGDVDGVIWEADPGRRCFGFVSAGATRLLGYPAEDWLKAGFWDAHLHSDDRDTALAAARQAAEEGDDYSLEYRMVAADERIVYVYDRVRIFNGENGVPRSQGLMVDVSERRRAEELQQQRDASAALNADLGASLAMGDTLQVALQHSAEAIVRHLDAAFARIWILDETADVLFLEASAGLYTHLDGTHARIAVGQFKIGAIAQEKTPHVTNAVAGDPRVSDPEWARREGMVAFAGYPLLVEDKLVGVLGMFARHKLSQGIIEDLALVADRIAAWIARRRVEEVLRLKAEREAFLAAATAAVAASLDHKATLDALAQVAIPYFADYCLVADVSSAGRPITARAHADASRVPLLDVLTSRPLRNESSLANRAIQTGEPQLAEEITAEQLESAAESVEQAEALRVLAPRSSLFVPLRGQEGKILGVIGFAYAESGRRYRHTDIDLAQELALRAAASVERAALFAAERRAHEQAEDAQRRLETIFQTSPVGMALWDRDLRFLAINRALAEINGIAPELHYGRTVDELFEDSDPGLVTLLHKAVVSGEAFVGESLPVHVPGRPDRAPGYYDVQYLPMKNPAGSVEGLLGYVLDVTERVRLEKSQRLLADATVALTGSLDYEQTLESLAEIAVPAIADYCAVFTLEVDQTVRRVAARHVRPEMSEVVERLGSFPVDYESDRGVGAVLRTAQHLFAAEVDERLVDSTFDDPERRASAHDLGAKSVIIMPLVAAGQTLGAVLLAITESARRYETQDVVLAEELARRAALALENARLFQRAEDALAMRNRFLSMASHELKTPITSVKGYSQVLLRKARREGNQEWAEMLEIVDSETDRMSRLIGELLDITRIELGKLDLEYASVDLSDMLRQSIAQMAIGAGDFDFNLADEDEGLAVEGDRMRLEQVVTNLLTNAIKYSAEVRRVDLTLRRDGDYAVIEVSDWGIGVPKGQTANVFELFFRGSNLGGPHRSGLGLGLYISKAIVEEHGGSITLSRRDEGGSTFRVRLPLRDGVPEE